jgi:hypothetical protein
MGNGIGNGKQGTVVSRVANIVIAANIMIAASIVVAANIVVAARNCLKFLNGVVNGDAKRSLQALLLSSCESAHAVQFVHGLPLAC